MIARLGEKLLPFAARENSRGEHRFKSSCGSSRGLLPGTNLPNYNKAEAKFILYSMRSGIPDGCQVDGSCSPAGFFHFSNRLLHWSPAFFGLLQFHLDKVSQMHLSLWALRAFFFIVAVGLAFSLTSGRDAPDDFRIKMNVYALFTIGSLAVIAIDILIKRKRIDLITSVYFGILVGLLLTYIFSLALTPLFESYATTITSDFALTEQDVRSIVLSFLGVVISYSCVSILWQTKDDFRFIIPYVEFSKDVKGAVPYILDTSVVIDGRIADIVETGIIENQLILPRFALMELQAIADSSDKLRRSRGRRGLDVLNRLRNNETVDLKIYDQEVPEMKGQPVDMKLLILAKSLGGKIVTGDFNLNKVAKLQNVPVINLNEVANSLKPVFLPGEHLKVKVVKAGEGLNQGIGYLDDGTMIVIEDGRQHIGENVDITVTSMLQTNAGRMVFGRYEANA